MSDYTVVKKRELRNYENFMYFMGIVSAMTIASIVAAIVTKSIKAFASAIVFSALVLGGLYSAKDSFPTVRKALRYARGENE